MYVPYPSLDSRIRGNDRMEIGNDEIEIMRTVGAAAGAGESAPRGVSGGGWRIVPFFEAMKIPPRLTGAKRMEHSAWRKPEGLNRKAHRA